MTVEMKLHSLFAGALCAFSITLSAQAASTLLNNVTLGQISGLGTDSTYASWTELRGTTIPGSGSFPGSTMWAPVPSQAGNDTNSLLSKISNGAGGGPYGASGSIYFGGFSGDANVNGGTLAVGSTVPLDGLTTVLFQLQIGEATTYDFFNHALPTLSYTTSSGTVSSVAATYSSLYNQFYNGTVTMPTGEEPLYTNSYALQWDLSGVSEDITSFSISFTGVQHAQLYGVSLQQGNEGNSSSILPSAVPEPSALLIGALGLLPLLRRKR